VSALRDSIFDALGADTERRGYLSTLEALPPLHLALLADDLVDLCADERVFAREAVGILRTRIGGWQALPSYCATLAAGHARRARTETQGGAR
jgi:hypothetical protein